MRLVGQPPRTSGIARSSSSSSVSRRGSARFRAPVASCLGCPCRESAASGYISRNRSPNAFAMPIRATHVPSRNVSPLSVISGSIQIGTKRRAP